MAEQEERMLCGPNRPPPPDGKRPMKSTFWPNFTFLFPSLGKKEREKKRESSDHLLNVCHYQPASNSTGDRNFPDRWRISVWVSDPCWTLNITSNNQFLHCEPKHTSHQPVSLCASQILNISIYFWPKPKDPN